MAHAVHDTTAGPGKQVLSYPGAKAVELKGRQLGSQPLSSLRALHPK